MSMHPLPLAIQGLPTALTDLHQLRTSMDRLMDWATDLDRERRPRDPMGTDPSFEPIRQRQRAIDRTLREMADKVEYLTAAFSNVEVDLNQLQPADPEPVNPDI